MPSRPTLEKATAAAIDALLKKAGESERGGDIARSVALGQQAWNSLPDPKMNWDFYPEIIARGMLRKAQSMGNPGEVEAWLKTTYEAYGDPMRANHFVNMLEGGAYRTLHNDDAAYAVFGKVYGRDGRKGFSGENLAHLEWYLKERARRGE